MVRKYKVEYPLKPVKNFPAKMSETASLWFNLFESVKEKPGQIFEVAVFENKQAASLVRTRIRKGEIAIPRGNFEIVAVRKKSGTSANSPIVSALYARYLDNGKMGGSANKEVQSEINAKAKAKADAQAERGTDREQAINDG